MPPDIYKNVEMKNKIGTLELSLFLPPDIYCIARCINSLQQLIPNIHLFKNNTM